MMEMPKPTEQHRKLESLAGNWVGEEKMHPSPWDPKGGMAVSRVQAKVDLGGFFVVMDYTQERDGKPGYKGHGLFGFDPEKNRYSMHWYDSMCATSWPAYGTWEGNRLAFEHQTPFGHCRYTYLFEGTGRYTFTIENSEDGKSWAAFIEARYSRK